MEVGATRKILVLRKSTGSHTAITWGKCMSALAQGQVSLSDGRDGLAIKPLELYPDGRAVARELLTRVPGDKTHYPVWNADETVIRISEEGL